MFQASRKINQETPLLQNMSDLRVYLDNTNTATSYCISNVSLSIETKQKSKFKNKVADSIPSFLI